MVLSSNHSGVPPAFEDSENSLRSIGGFLPLAYDLGGLWYHLIHSCSLQILEASACCFTTCITVQYGQHKQKHSCILVTFRYPAGYSTF
jgi:hypothetical protein